MNATPANASVRAPEPTSPTAPPDDHDDIVYPGTIPFVLVHLACFGVLWSGVTPLALWMAAGLYLVRMWAVTAGYHRYFAHRSYRTSRVFQFLLAVLGSTAAQRGVIWWAAVHRHHHLHSDTEQDAHSPRHMGFIHSHVGWIFRPRRARADYSTVQDLTRYPELVWLDRWSLVPAVALGVLTFLVGGWPGLFVGFFLSTIVLYHCVFSINSLAHVVGKQRYLTGDDSKNNWWLALITLGEGWHNNHHHYQSATAQGWRWYEIDISYYVLKALSWTRLVWDLRAPPAKVVANEQPLGRKTVERVAQQVAASFPIDRLAAQAREAWESIPSLQELTVRAQGLAEHAPTREEMRARLQELREEAAERIQAIPHPHLPTVEHLRARAGEMFADSPSLGEVAERARQLIALAVSARVLASVTEGG